ncbi:MAG: ankyrin repeat domain-containing protein, partial [Wolbachia endosymbiont of Menacanthus eurysternus]|nr:ankyrin repeat domain-containing protein [Wolbachia endosymbiont of Menacanthus eurysternus]
MNHVFYGEAALLHLAAKYGIVEMVKALIENGANLNVADNFGEVPLCYAVQYGEVEVMRILIENNADVKALNEFGEGLLHLAAQGVPGCSKTAIVKLLIDNGADVDAISVLGKKTPLHSATTLNNNIDIVRALIENGASVNVLDFYENTPLHYAAQYGCLGIVKILIENGADVNRVNKYDRDAPLHLAAENNHLETVKYLVDKGADVHVQNIRRKVPIDYAKEKGCQEIIEYLTDKMAEIPNEKDKALSVYHDEYFDDDDFLDSYYAMQDKRLNKGKERKPLKEESKCSIQSYQKQQGKLFKFISRSIQNIEIRQVRQGLYLPSFEARNVKINGKCIAITRGLSQGMFSNQHRLPSNNLQTS